MATEKNSNLLEKMLLPRETKPLSGEEIAAELNSVVDTHTKKQLALYFTNLSSLEKQLHDLQIAYMRGQMQVAAIEAELEEFDLFWDEEGLDNQLTDDLLKIKEKYTEQFKELTSKIYQYKAAISDKEEELKLLNSYRKNISDLLHPWKATHAIHHQQITNELNSQQDILKAALARQLPQNINVDIVAQEIIDEFNQRQESRPTMLEQQVKYQKSIDALDNAEKSGLDVEKESKAIAQKSVMQSELLLRMIIQNKLKQFDPNNTRTLSDALKIMTLLNEFLLPLYFKHSAELMQQYDPSQVEALKQSKYYGQVGCLLLLIENIFREIEEKSKILEKLEKEIKKLENSITGNQVALKAEVTKNLHENTPLPMRPVPKPSFSRQKDE